MSSALEHEATDAPNTVEHFDRQWALPSRFGVADERRLNLLISRQVVRNDTTALAEVFLSPEDFEAFLILNPTRAEAVEFGDKIAQALGFDDPGNS